MTDSSFSLLLHIHLQLPPEIPSQKHSLLHLVSQQGHFPEPASPPLTVAGEQPVLALLNPFSTLKAQMLPWWLSW